jgi:hypothetical protein
MNLQDLRNSELFPSEAAQQRAAAIQLYEKGLRLGPQCLVCRCWNRPCLACQPNKPVAALPPVPLCKELKHIETVERMYWDAVLGEVA